MMNFRFAHTTVGEESYSSVYDARRSKRSIAVDQRVSGFASGLAAAFRSIARWNQCRKTVRELRRLDDRVLRDIGLHRDDIGYVAHGLSRRRDGWPLV